MHGGALMIATIEHVEVLDKTDELVAWIIQSDIMEQYVEAYKALKSDEEAQHLINEFNRTKEDYEFVERFGRYHPNYNEVMRNVRSSKRKMDLHPTVATFKR